MSAHNLHSILGDKNGRKPLKSPIKEWEHQKKWINRKNTASCENSNEKKSEMIGSALLVMRPDLSPGAAPPYKPKTTVLGFKTKRRWLLSGYSLSSPSARFGSSTPGWKEHPLTRFWTGGVCLRLRMRARVREGLVAPWLCVRPPHTGGWAPTIASGWNKSWTLRCLVGRKPGFYTLLCGHCGTNCRLFFAFLINSEIYISRSRTPQRNVRSSIMYMVLGWKKPLLPSVYYPLLGLFSPKYGLAFGSLILNFSQHPNFNSKNSHIFSSGIMWKKYLM